MMHWASYLRPMLLSFCCFSIGTIHYSDILIRCTETPTSNGLLTAQQKARIVYDFALNGEDYCQLQRLWDEHDKNGTALGYPVRPKKNEILRYKEQLLKLGLKAGYDEKIQNAQQYDKQATTTPTSTTTTSSSSQGVSTNMSNQNLNRLSTDENRTRTTSNKIAHYLADESKLTEDDESFLLRTVISSNNLPLGDSDMNKDNKTNKDSYESEVKKLGQRCLSSLFKKLSDNINLKEHNPASSDYDEPPSNINSTKYPDDDKDKVLHYERSRYISIRNMTVKFSDGQIHYIYWLLDNLINGSKRFILHDEASHLIEDNLSSAETQKIMCNLNIIKLIEPYQDKVKQEQKPDAKDNSGPMSFLQAYLPSTQSLDSWEFYIIVFIIMFLFITLVLALIILCCRSLYNQQYENQIKKSGDKSQSRTRLGEAESSTYLSFSHEGPGQDSTKRSSNDDPHAAKSIWKKVSQFNDSTDDVNAASMQVSSKDLSSNKITDNSQKNRPAQFEWYSFEGKRIDNTHRQFHRSSLKEQTGTMTTIASNSSGRKPTIARDATGNQDSTSTRSNFGTKQILWAQDLLHEEINNELKYQDRVKERTMDTFLVSNRSNDPNLTDLNGSSGGFDHNEASRRSELVMVKEKLVPIVKVPSQSQKTTLVDDQPYYHAHRRKAPVVPHEYMNTPKHSLDEQSSIMQRDNIEKKIPSRRGSINQSNSNKSKERWGTTNDTFATGSHMDIKTHLDPRTEGISTTQSQQSHHNRHSRSNKYENSREIPKSDLKSRTLNRPTPSSIQVIQEHTAKTDEASSNDNVDDSRRPTIIHIELSGRTQSMVDQIREELTKIETRDIRQHKNTSQSEASKISSFKQSDASNQEDSQIETTRQQITERSSSLIDPNVHQLDDRPPSTSEA